MMAVVLAKTRLQETSLHTSGYATEWKAEKSRLDLPQRQGVSLNDHTSSGSTQPPIRGVQGFFPEGVERQLCEPGR
jgi:hypothetical protein